MANENKAFKVHVISPSGTIYEGDVTSLSGHNEKGNFDILFYHMNFISIIDGKISLHEVSGKMKDIKITKGIVKTLDNTVYIFVGISHELDPSFDGSTIASIPQ